MYNQTLIIYFKIHLVYPNLFSLVIEPYFSSPIEQSCEKYYLSFCLASEFPAHDLSSHDTF